ncbi:hypothetical protein T10_13349 [Trichinella papuae]|uniref:Uncharacterized protein n=1 Tax=Trichinella papuae TaxID=268474 RepID=A0A0V1MGG2_9BILA|nr:hypothetical protein T10_13349 [Trichinella papuae]
MLMTYEKNIIFKYNRLLTSFKDEGNQISHFNGSSTARYELTVARLEELFIQYFSSKTARHEKHKKENTFR